MNTEKKSWLTIEGAEVLYQNKNWSIEKVKDNEIAITDGYTVMYAFISKTGKTLVADRHIAPKYIMGKALKLANKHIVSVYAD